MPPVNLSSLGLVGGLYRLEQVSPTCGWDDICLRTEPVSFFYVDIVKSIVSHSHLND